MKYDKNFATFSRNRTKYEAMSYQALRFNFTITITCNVPLFIEGSRRTTKVRGDEESVREDVGESPE